MEIDYTNEVMMNHYKKQELIKAKKRLDEKMSKTDILKLADKRFITEDEIKEALGFDFIEDEITNKGENSKNEMIHKKDIIAGENKIKAILIEDLELEDFPNQPFKSYDEDKKKEMIESIKNFGIMQPLIVRPISKGKYQILAGHNRRNCARELGITKYPCIIKENLTDEEARIYLIDTNLCTRDKISPMERARAYKIKYDTYKKRNVKTSMLEEVKRDNIGRAKAELIKEEKISNGSIQRFLRLNYLIPSLQEKVDKGIIAVGVGEKISFLPVEEQKFINEILNENVKITENIAIKIRKQSEKYKKEDIENFLVKEEILEIIKPKKKDNENRVNYISVNFYEDEIDRYFGVINDIDELKRKIIYSLEETYIKS